MFDRLREKITGPDLAIYVVGAVLLGLFSLLVETYAYPKLGVSRPRLGNSGLATYYLTAVVVAWLFNAAGLYRRHRVIGALLTIATATAVTLWFLWLLR